MSDLFDRTIIEQLNSLKQRLANIEAQDTIKRDSSTGLPYFPTLTAGSVLFAGSGGLLSQDNANFFWDDGTNRLGIGTTSPSATLDLARGSAVNGTLVVNGTTHGCYFHYSTTEAIYLRGGKTGSNVIINDTHNGGVLIANGGGAVGIGAGATSGLSRTLTLDTGTHSYLAWNKSGTEKFLIGWEDVGTGRVVMYSGAPGYVQTWLASGNVGINDTGPAGRLTVKGTGTTSSTYSFVSNNSSGSALFYTRDDGLVFSNQAITVSDRRAKKNVKDLDYGLAEVKRLKPKRYDSEFFDHTNQMGFLADEVALVMPNVVQTSSTCVVCGSIEGGHDDENDEGEKRGHRFEAALAVNYTALIPVLVNAVTDLSSKVADLEAQIAKLKPTKSA
jgi:hypothetical protein